MMVAPRPPCGGVRGAVVQRCTASRRAPFVCKEAVLLYILRRDQQATTRCLALIRADEHRMTERSRATKNTIAEPFAQTFALAFSSHDAPVSCNARGDPR